MKNLATNFPDCFSVLFLLFLDNKTMTLRLTQTRTILQIPRVLPTLMARSQSTQINPITNATTGYKKAILNYQQRRNASASAGADRYQSSR